MVNGFTRTWNNQPDSCLDQLWTNCPERIIFVQNIPRSFSDHNLINCAVKTKDRREDKQDILTRDRSNLDEVAYKEKFDRIDWSEMYNCDNIDIVNSFFESKVLEILDCMAPQKYVQKRKAHRNWVSTDMIDKMNDRDKLRDIARISGDQTDWNTYKKARNNCVKELKNCKTSHYNELYKKLEKEKTSRNLYSLTNQLIGNKNGGSPQQFVQNGNLIRKPVDMANLLMDYYVEKIRNIIDKMQPSGRNPLRLLEKSLENWTRRDEMTSFNFREISSVETETLISSLSNSTAQGHDRIDALGLKMAGKSIIEPLRYIINLSLSKGKFARKWKLSVITPRHKSREMNRMSTSSYRPVVVCSTTSKLVERAAQKQLLKHFEDSNLLNPSNHAYRSKLSTTTTLTEICDELHQGAEDKQINSIMALDFTAAFDCVSHPLLMKKLTLYKIGNNARAWIQDFLIWRTQYVSIGRAKSRMEPVLRGVPQGSVIGPILFAIFTNELTEAVKVPSCQNESHLEKTTLFGQQCEDCGILTIYADDSTYVTRDKNRNMNEMNMRRSLDELSGFILDNQLAINLPKTGISECMIKQKRAKNPGNPPSLIVQDENGQNKEIKDSQYLRILGANVQSNMSWQMHLEGGKKAMFPAARKFLGHLRHQGDLIPRSCRNNLAKTLILSRLQYLMPLWGGAGQTYINKCQTIMNTAARWVSGLARRTRTSTLMEHVGWFTAKEMIRIATGLHTWKLINFRRPERPLLRMTIMDDRTITVQHPRLQFSQECLRWRAAREWNLLPQNLRDCQSIGRFKNSLKQLIRLQRPRPPEPTGPPGTIPGQ